ncbi:MAG: hypothetical protein PHP62_01740 [Candidatus Moranbacteria bacterium]|nr:hypothetical protein [Candidatus Moranbacteria bacterium]
MTAIDFTKKSLNQRIFSKRAVKAMKGRNSSAFKAILGDKDIARVINKTAEKKVFYGALKKRGLSSDRRGITRNVFKKVLGDIEHSGNFSHHEMMELREHLVGGHISTSIIREHGDKQEHQQIETQRHQQQQIDTQKHQQQRAATNNHINELIAKGHEKARTSFCAASSVITKNADSTNTDKYHNHEQKNNDIRENVLVKLGSSDNNIRKYENSSFSPRVSHFSENHSTSFGHITGLKPSQYNHFGARDIGIEEAKTRLASIQDKEYKGDNDEIK